MAVNSGDCALKTCDEFFDYLTSNGISSDDAGVLKNEYVDEQCAYGIKDTQLKELGLKLGPRISIMRLIGELKPSQTDNTEQLVQDNPPYVDSVDAAPAKPYATENRDLVSVLSGYGTQGQQLLEKYKNGLDESDRELLNRILVEDLLANCERPNYPRDFEQENLAKAVIKCFPDLSQTVDKRVPPYSMWFTRNATKKGTRLGGRIPTRVSNVQRRMPQSEKRYAPRKSIKMSATPQAKDVNAVVEEMKSIIPNAENFEEISRCMRDTFHYRHNKLMDGKTLLADVFEEFPHLLHYNGELIAQDFALQRTDVQGYIGIITQIIPVEETRLNKKMEVEQQCLFDIFLSLPNSNVRNIRLSDDYEESFLKSLVEWVDVNIDLNDYIKEEQTHKVVIIAQGLFPEALALFLKIESQVIPLPCKWLAAVDILFKAHYVFHLKYHRRTKTFFNFLESYIYKIPDVKAYSASRKALAFFEKSNSNN